jgi:ATP-dependent Lon protease
MLRHRWCSSATLNHPIETLVQNTATDLFQPLPKEFDLAIIDRLHFYLPGWEVPKNSKDMLTGHYGCVTDAGLPSLSR